ncbi:hypothetical protein BH11PSE11_BH11PSE11_10350 [soil metagenome]
MKTSSNPHHDAEARRRIFVIDSDKASNEALESILADDNETFVMPNVVSALDWACHWPPQLILLGTGVIATEGAGTVSRFKKRVPGVRIMIVCDRLDDESVKQAQMMGAESALLRPLMQDTVKDKLRMLFSRRPSRVPAFS